MKEKEQVKEELEQAYQNIIESSDCLELCEDDDLSGVFLASPRDSYFDSERKVMIIGQETKGWRKNKCKIKYNLDFSLEAIRDSMDSTLDTNNKKPGTSKFGQFYLKASKALTCNEVDSEHAALWSNQFCISYKKHSPIQSDKFLKIRDLSQRLLKAQFDILKPDVAIFTVGSGRDKYIKEALDYETVNVVVPKRLWHFKVGKTHCFRCNHPRWHGANEFLNQAIDLAGKCT